LRRILVALWLILALLYTFPLWLPLIAPVTVRFDVAVGPAEPFRAAELVPWAVLVSPLLALSALTIWWVRRSRA
jgi:hypothetical protein